MFESKTQIDTVECELSEKDLMTVVGGANNVKVAARAALFINVIGNKESTGTLSVEDLLNLSGGSDL